MTNTAAVALIAQRLTDGLTHPGDGDKQPAKMIPLPPGWRGNSGLAPEQAAHFKQQAGLPDNDVPRLIAEAIVHLLETDGASTIISSDQLEQLRADAATLDDAPPGATVAVHCHCNAQKPLFTAPVDRPKVTVDGRMMAKGIAAVCTCG